MTFIDQESPVPRGEERETRKTSSDRCQSSMAEAEASSPCLPSIEQVSDTSRLQRLLWVVVTADFGEVRIVVSLNHIR